LLLLNISRHFTVDGLEHGADKGEGGLGDSCLGGDFTGVFTLVAAGKILDIENAGSIS